MTFSFFMLLKTSSNKDLRRVSVERGRNSDLTLADNALTQMIEGSETGLFLPKEGMFTP